MTHQAIIIPDLDDWGLILQSLERFPDPSIRKPGGQPTTAKNFWARVDATQDDCWPWTGSLNEKGYGSVGYRGVNSVGAHRVSWALTHDGELPAEWVLHHCDNPPCVRPSHHFLGDALANNADRERKGRSRGFVGRAKSEHHAFYVTDEMVAQMRTLRAGRHTQQFIADAFGVSRGYVACIVRGVLPLHTKGGVR